MIDPPTITPEDLLDFHKGHFKSVPIGLERLNNVAETVSYPQDEPVPAQDPEDDLGYYPDGTKRTLTDKQIAFFRASELRQRVLASQKKNSEARRKQQSATEKATNSSFRESIEETKPFTPIANSTADYSTLFGQYSSYVLELDQGMDNRYISVSRRENIQDYYPVLPMHEL